MSLAERRWLRLFTLCILYVAQGIPWGFMAITLPAYLAERGLDAGAVGSALAMTTLPYSFKWIWGPLIDAFTIPSLGRRRPWILMAQGMMALTVGAMLLIPDLTQNLDLLVWMIFFHTIFNSMQDVAVDALAVDLLDDDERGQANGLMYASKYGGGAIGGAGLATVIDLANLQVALALMTVLLLAIMLAPLLVRERSGPPPPRPELGALLRSLGTAFTLRSTLLGAVVMLTYQIASGLLSAIATVLFVQQLDWDAKEYAQIAGGPGLFAGLIGSVAGGFLADRVGTRRLAAIASAVLAAQWLAFGLLESHWHDRTLVYGLFLLQPFFQGMLTVSLFAVCMAISWPQIAATQFTAYMALANFSTTLGYKLAGTAEAVLESWEIYLVVAAIQLSVIAWLPFIDPTETRRKLPLPPGQRPSLAGMIGGAVLLVGFLTLLIVLVILPLLQGR